MRILILTQALRGGGAEQVCRSWALSLVASGHEVTVLSQRAEPKDLAALPDPIPAGLQISFMPATSMSTTRRVFHIRRFARAGGFDAAISLLTYPNLLLLLALRKSGIPTVISEHNVPSILLRNQGLSQRIQLVVARLLYRSANHVIAVSHAVATDLKCNFKISGKQGSVLHNGILEKPASAAIGAVGLASEVNILVPARITQQKRPDKAVRIAELLANDGYRVSLTFVGDVAPQYVNTPLLKSDTIQLQVLPWRDDWYELAVGSSVVLLASDIEGLGNVLVEAAEHGLPSVAGSWALGTADAMIPGLTGCLAESDSLRSYADAILRAARIPTAASADTWLAEFSHSQSTARLNGILASVQASPSE